MCGYTVLRESKIWTALLPCCIGSWGMLDSPNRLCIILPQHAIWCIKLVHWGSTTNKCTYRAVSNASSRRVLSDPHLSVGVRQEWPSTMHLSVGVRKEWPSTMHLSVRVRQEWPSTMHLSVGVRQEWSSTIYLSEEVRQEWPLTMHLTEGLRQMWPLTMHLSEGVRQEWVEPWRCAVWYDCIIVYREQLACESSIYICTRKMHLIITLNKLNRKFIFLSQYKFR